MPRRRRITTERPFSAGNPGRAVGRRAVLASGAALAATGLFGLGVAPIRAQGAFTPPGPLISRTIPATGEAVPAIGMGTWITFNVGQDEELRDHRAEIMRIFFARGGAMIDSSPMYGSSEAVIGHGLKQVDNAQSLFSATKVWTWSKADGPDQMEESRRLWDVERFDLMQIHNLLGWEGHLETLLEWKAQGRIRYIGVTTSHGSRHAEFEKIMREQPIDFVQFTYNILDREAEQRLLPLAAERGLAVIVNRPFRRKELFRLFQHHPLPGWIGEFDCTNWAQFFLKFILGHPAVTCAIPATSQIPHIKENMGALYGRLPDPALRRRMIDYVESL